MEQPHIVAFMLVTSSAGAASSLRWLPFDILQKIAKMAHRPRPQLRFSGAEEFELDLPLPIEYQLSSSAAIIALENAPGTSEHGYSVPYPHIQLPQRAQYIYLELSMDDVWSGSIVEVHDVEIEWIVTDDIPVLNMNGMEVPGSDNAWANESCPGRAVQQAVYAAGGPSLGSFDYPARSAH